MAPISYALRAEFDGTVTQELDDGTSVEVPAFTGGLITAGDRDVDIRVELDAGDGTIVVDDTADPALILALDNYPALKRTGTPEGSEPINPYANQPIANLRERATALGLELYGSPKKAELAAGLLAADQATASGDQVAGIQADGTLIFNPTEE